MKIFNLSIIIWFIYCSLRPSVVYGQTTLSCGDDGATPVWVDTDGDGNDDTEVCKFTQTIPFCDCEEKVECVACGDLQIAVDAWCNEAGSDGIAAPDTEAIYGRIEYWDVSEVTTMTSLFRNQNNCNPDISRWDVGNVEDMSSMFEDATNFNQDISGWDVSSVTGYGFSLMFEGATNFNVGIMPEYSFHFNWDVSNGEDFSFMFDGATSFNGDVSNWTPTSGYDFSFMFNGATSFNQDTSGWCTETTVTVFCGFMYDGSGVAFDANKQFGCTQCQTPSPSQAPSPSPSVSPSQSPSVSPSQSPSVSPSQSPSVSPSDSPSQAPSTAYQLCEDAVCGVCGGLHIHSNYGRLMSCVTRAIRTEDDCGAAISQTPGNGIGHILSDETMFWSRTGADRERALFLRGLSPLTDGDICGSTVLSICGDVCHLDDATWFACLDDAIYGDATVDECALGAYDEATWEYIGSQCGFAVDILCL